MLATCVCVCYVCMWLRVCEIHYWNTFILLQQIQFLVYNSLKSLNRYYFYNIGIYPGLYCSLNIHKHCKFYSIINIFNQFFFCKNIVYNNARNNNNNIVFKKREEEKKRAYHDILLRICSLYVFIHCSSGGTATWIVLALYSLFIYIFNSFFIFIL